MYLPLGCLLGLMARTRSARSFAMLVLAAAGVSLTFEFTQLFLVSRFPSIDDLICNTLGGALGVWFGLWLMTRLAPLLRPIRISSRRVTRARSRSCRS
jgi:glycopeptide antibiotics resistance protein